MVLPDGQNHFFFIVFVMREKHIGGENMRLDKFLKLSRVIKRRTVAASAACGESCSQRQNCETRP